MADRGQQGLACSPPCSPCRSTQHSPAYISPAATNHTKSRPKPPTITQDNLSPGIDPKQLSAGCPSRSRLMSRAGAGSRQRCPHAPQAADAPAEEPCLGDSIPPAVVGGWQGLAAKRGCRLASSWAVAWSGGSRGGLLVPGAVWEGAAGDNPVKTDQGMKGAGGCKPHCQGLPRCPYGCSGSCWSRGAKQFCVWLREGPCCGQLSHSAGVCLQPRAMPTRNSHTERDISLLCPAKSIL